MRTASLGLVVIVVALLAGSSNAWSRSAAAPATLKVEVIGKGKLTGTGISCGQGGARCYAAYGSNATDVVLTATAANGWTFSSWEDDGFGCAAPPVGCTISGPGDKTVTVVFTTNATVTNGTLNVAVSQDTSLTPAPHGTVTNDAGAPYTVDCGSHNGAPTADCNLSVVNDSVLTLVATPDTGYFFAGWGGACSGTGVSCTVSVNGATSVSANFVAGTTNTLTVKVDGPGMVTGGGINCAAGSTCDVEEAPTSTVTLTATPESGYAFTGWSGDCLGTQPTCTVQMNDARTVTASFDPLVPITITVNGNGKVTGAGVTCGPGPATCVGSAPPNTSAFLTATPATGSSVSWTGCTSPAGTTCRMTVNSSPLAVTATFSGGVTPPPSTLTLAVDVSGNGYVTSSNGAIYCTAAGGADCTASLQQNSTVTLTATAASGATADFDPGWGDDCDAATTTSCTLTMSTAKSVSAGFTGGNTTYTLSAQVQGSGSGTITGAGLKCSSSGGAGCSSPQAATATVTLSASAGSDSTFTGWGGACTGTATTCKVQMTAAKSVTATFGTSSPTGHALTITVVGAGTVKATGGICTAPAKQTRVCSQEYAAGAKVTLTATPAKGVSFLGWKGACTGAKATCTVTMTASAAVTASFGVPVLAAAGKALVTRTSTGYRVTLRYRAAESGTLKLTGSRAGKHFLTRSARARAGAGKLVVDLTRGGRYVFTLTLTSKSGRHTVRWTVVR